MARRTSAAHPQTSASLAGAGFSTFAVVVMQRRKRRAGAAAAASAPPEVAALKAAPASPAALGAAPSDVVPPSPVPPLPEVAPARGTPHWTCAITWHFGMRGANFRAMAFGPGVQGREIARSVKVDWPPIVPPAAEPDIVQAARGLARSLVAAGWRPADRGRDWYAQRFVWTRTEEPHSLLTPR